MNFVTQLAALITLSSLAAAPPAQQPETPDSRTPVGPPLAPLATRIGALLDAHHAHRQFSGAALVADGGEIIYQRAFGLANDDWNIRNSVDTKFRLGAITKQFTAMLVLLLVEDGKLEQQAPISRYLPDYPPQSGSRVTIHHLLNHTSGIPSYREREGWQEEMVRHHSVAEFVVRFCSEPLESEPGTKYRFNYSDYYLLGAIIEAVTGQTYGAALRERVLDPLEMHDTGFEDQDATRSSRATGYEEVADVRRIARWIDTSNLFASDGLYSTVSDLWKWDRALRHKRLLSGPLQARMFTPGKGGYGYGWHIDRHGIWHGGATPGFSAMIGRAPAQGRCVILLSNSGFSSVPEAAMGIAEIFEGKPATTPDPRPERALARSILDDGVDAGLAEFARLPAATRYHLVEPAIYTIGQRLLAQRRTAEAVRLFEFNTRALEGAAQTVSKKSKRWEGLGEANLQAGNRRLAIENFKKALELYPANTGARQRLDELRGK